MQRAADYAKEEEGREKQGKREKESVEKKQEERNNCVLNIIKKCI